MCNNRILKSLITAILGVAITFIAIPSMADKDPTVVLINNTEHHFQTTCFVHVENQGIQSVTPITVRPRLGAVYTIPDWTPTSKLVGVGCKGMSGNNFIVYGPGDGPSCIPNRNHFHFDPDIH